jgi:outer membrane protein, heavy metal efflux system
VGSVACLIPGTREYQEAILPTIAFVVLTFGVAPIPGPAHVEPQPPPLTVADAVTLALRNNPVHQAASRQVGAARAGVRAARSLANPSVTVTPTIVGLSGADDLIAVAQPLELNGARRARTRVAEAALRGAESTSTVTARELVREVKRAYYELARTQEVRDLQRESVVIAEEFERIAHRQVEVGTRPGIDLTQLQVELTRARQLQLQAEAGLHLAAAELNILMGRSPDIPVAAASRLTFVPHPVEAQPSTQVALARRAEVAAEQAGLEALQQQSRLIRTEGRPDLTLGARLDSFSSSPQTGGVGLGITFPFLDYGSRRSRLRQTRLLAEAQAVRVEATRNQVRLDLEQALTRLRTAEQLVRQYQEGLVDQARRLAEAERTRFQTGAGSPLSVLEAQRTYRSVLSDYYGALAAHETAKAELEWATGSVEVAGDLPAADRADATGSKR